MNTGNFGVFSTKVQNVITVLIQLSPFMNELAPFQLFRATHLFFCVCELLMPIYFTITEKVHLNF